MNSSKVGKTVWWFDPTSPSFDGQPLAGLVVAEESAGTVDVAVFSPRERLVLWFTGVELVPTTAPRAAELGPYCRWPDGSPEQLGEQLTKAVAESEVRRLATLVGATETERDGLREAVGRFPTDPNAPLRGGPS